jgi:ABC-type branched-subunit amino acid transport system ATPase component
MGKMRWPLQEHAASTDTVSGLALFILSPEIPGLSSAFILPVAGRPLMTGGEFSMLGEPSLGLTPKLLCDKQACPGGLSGSGMLKIVGANKSFGGLRVLKNIDVTIEQGRIHGIIGPNGSGKTTLFNCISGLIPLDGGRISFAGRDITALRADRIAHLGLRRTFQGGKLVPSLTTLENIMSGASALPEKALKREALELLDSAGMASAADRWAGDLTWAERQFVQILRAIIGKPKLLLLDEPVSGMAARETALMTALIRRIRGQGVTVAVVSHDMKMLMDLAEWVTALNFGEKIAEGAPEAVQNDPLVREAYLGY